MKHHLLAAHEFWRELLHPEDIVIDATCGNGKDTSILADLVPNGAVYSIDIQPQAIASAKTVIYQKNVIFLLQSHVELPKLTHVRLVVYNLGYLPKGDKSITTKSHTTLQSIVSAMALIVDDGAICITCYPGHPAGAEELQALQNMTAALTSWHVSWQQWYEKGPALLIMKKAH